MERGSGPRARPRPAREKLTSNATLSILIQAGAVVRHEPRLRFDQQPERFVYLTSECHERLTGLGLAPGEEEAEPHPKDQAEALLAQFCSGGLMERSFDYERRGARPFWLWRTRSLRLGGAYLDRSTYFVAGLEYKAAFGPKVPAGERLKSSDWYVSCLGIINNLGLLGSAWMGDDPHAEE